MTGIGYFFGLSRDDAKRLFAQRDDRSLERFIRQELMEALGDTERAQSSGLAWEAIHRCLGDGTRRPDGGDMPLNQCVLGGRQLYQDDDRIATLVRPDLVPPVSAALAEITREWFKQRYDQLDPEDCGPLSEEDFCSTWQCFERVRQFYQRCAKNQLCVLFAVVE